MRMAVRVAVALAVAMCMAFGMLYNTFVEVQEEHEVLGSVQQRVRGLREERDGWRRRESRLAVHLQTLTDRELNCTRSLESYAAALREADQAHQTAQRQSQQDLAEVKHQVERLEDDKRKAEEREQDMAQKISQMEHTLEMLGAKLADKSSALLQADARVKEQADQISRLQGQISILKDEVDKAAAQKDEPTDEPEAEAQEADPTEADQPEGATTPQEAAEEATKEESAAAAEEGPAAGEPHTKAA